MADKRPLSALAAAMAAIATTRGDAPIILVAAPATGEPRAASDAVDAIASAIGYEPTHILLAHAVPGDLAPGVRAGAALAAPSSIDTLHVLDAHHTAQNAFATSFEQETLIRAIQRVDEAPLRRKPIVAIVPTADGILAHLETAIRDVITLGSADVVRIQL